MQPEEKEQLPLERQPWWKRAQLRSFDIVNFTLIAMICLYVVYSAFLNIYRNYQTKLEIGKARDEITQLKLEKEKLKSLLAYYETRSYQEIELRRRLLLKKEGETVVALKGSEPLGYEPPAEEEQTYESPLLEWYDYYFGPRKF